MGDERLALGICGSPRHNGNTITIMREALRGARKCGMETKEVFLVDLTIGPCLACMSCKEGSPGCAISDDVDGIIREACRAEVIIVGSPIYMGDVTGQCKVLLDRMFCVLGPGPDWEFRLNYPEKHGLVVVSSEATWPGYADQALKTMKYLLRHLGIVDSRVTEIVQQGLPPAGVAIHERPEVLQKAFDIGVTLASQIG